MRARWRTLFGCALTALIAACGIGFLGAVAPTRKRWPAAVAVACAAPMALTMLGLAPRLPRLLSLSGAPGVLMFGGSAATVVVALYLLISTPPPLPDDRIPPARLT
jgi:hypothetical protein